jgi:hypothetical protein
MSKKDSSLDRWGREFDRLRHRISQTSWISQGSVQDRTGRQNGGAGYQWTRKVAGKTVSVALTAEQFHRMREAVDNYRQLRVILREMEKISRHAIFESSPHPARRKRLSPKVLGLI